MIEFRSERPWSWANQCPLREGRRGAFLVTHYRAHFCPPNEPSFNTMHTDLGGTWKAGWTLVPKVQGIKEGPGISFGDSGISEALGRESRPRPS